LNTILSNETPAKCLEEGNYVDAILALNLSTGEIVWNFTAFGVDWWNAGCYDRALRVPVINPIYCSSNPNIPGQDWDFAQGPMLFTNSKNELLVGAASKGGVVFAVDRKDGTLKWLTGVGPGSDVGGMLWGSAVDKKRMYVGLANGRMYNYTLPNGTKICYGSWAALDIDSGDILWQTADPVHLSFEQCATWDFHNQSLSAPIGALSAGNGLVFGSSTEGSLYALNQDTGEIIWREITGYSGLRSAPSLLEKWLYWSVGSEIRAWSVP